MSSYAAQLARKTRNQIAIAIVLAAFASSAAKAADATPPNDRGTWYEKAVKWKVVTNPKLRECDTDSDCDKAILELGCVEANVSTQSKLVVLCPVFKKEKAAKLTKQGRYCLTHECE